MAPVKIIKKKKVMFANASGKPLTTVRYVNKEGRGVKLSPLKRKQTPAKLDTIHLKKMRAEAAARKRLDAAKLQVSLVEKADKNIKTMEKEIEKKIKKTANPGEKANLKMKQNRLDAAKKIIAAKKNGIIINYNLAKNKLKAQKRAG